MYRLCVSKKHDTAAPADLSFEEALRQVEAIIDRIESGEVGLEASVEEYDKGVALIRRCRDILARAEQRVEELNSDLSPRDPSARASGSKEAGAQAPRQPKGKASGSDRGSRPASDSGGGAGADEEEIPF